MAHQSKTPGRNLDLQPITFPWIGLCVICLVRSAKWPLRAGKGDFRCFEWRGCVPVYMAEVYPAISPAVVAGRQGPLAGPALTAMLPGASWTWSLWEPDLAGPGVSTPHLAGSLIPSYLLGFAGSCISLGSPVSPVCVTDSHLCATQSLQSPSLSKVSPGFRTGLLGYFMCIASSAVN